MRMGNQSMSSTILDGTKSNQFLFYSYLYNSNQFSNYWGGLIDDALIDQTFRWDERVPESRVLKYNEDNLKRQKEHKIAYEASFRGAVG